MLSRAAAFVLVPVLALAAAGCRRRVPTIDPSPTSTPTPTIAGFPLKPSTKPRGPIPNDAATTCRVRFTGKKSTFVGQPALEVEFANRGTKPIRLCGIWTYAYDAQGKQEAMDIYTMNKEMAPGETTLKGVMVRDETTDKSLMERPDLVFEPIVGMVIFADDVEWEVPMPEQRAKGSLVPGTVL